MSAVDAARAGGELRHALQRAFAALRAGQLDVADAAFGRALELDPDCPEALDGIGLTAYRLRQLQRSERAFRRLLELRQGDAHAQQRLAATLRAMQRAEEAVKLYAAAAEKLPNDANLHNNWGNALMDLARFEEAVRALRRAVEIAPREALYRCNLARALIRSERAEEALAMLQEGRSLGIDGANYTAELGHAFLAAKRYEEAVASYREARAGGCTDKGMLHNLGTALQFLGDMQGAEEAYRAALAVDPNFAVARRHLSGIRRYGSADADIAELLAALEESGRTALERSELHLGLAKAFDDIGEFDRAFHHLQAANQIIRTTFDYSAEQNGAFVDGMIATFDRAFFERRRDWGLPTERPIFIVGMPRSGTTLVEQILCSHPLVFGAGELMTIYEIVLGCRQSLDVPNMHAVAEALTPATTREAAGKYMKYINDLDGEAPHVSDKLPFNFRYLGYIALFFPRARIIHCRRDPLDIGLSCYFARFHEQLSFSFNLTEIGRYYRDYERLMQHWREVLTNPMLEISYERLVADQETETRRMLDFCGLDWDDRCLEFHRTQRPVLTASNWQVRQPMYATSVGRWRNYARHLLPLIAALGLELPTPGEEPLAVPASPENGQ